MATDCANPLNTNLISVSKSGSVRQDERLRKVIRTDEVFTITKRVPRRQPVYKIADYHGEELKERFTGRNCRAL